MNPDLFRIRDESPEDSGNLSEPAVILQELIEDLEGALDQLRGLGTDLSIDEATDCPLGMSVPIRLL